MIDANHLLSGKCYSDVWSTTEPGYGLLNDENIRTQYAEEWQKVIDSRLIEWGRYPEVLEDQDIVPPSREILSIACKVANQLRTLSPPDRVVTDGNGGIVFERRDDDHSEVIHIWDDCDVEYQLFRGTRLVERRLM